MPLRAQFAAPQKIAFGHDSDQLAFLVEDRQTADAVLEHQPRSFKDRFVRVDANHFWRHHVFDSHDPTLD